MNVNEILPFFSAISVTGLPKNLRPSLLALKSVAAGFDVSVSSVDFVVPGHVSPVMVSDVSLLSAGTTVKRWWLYVLFTTLLSHTFWL